MNLDIKGMFDKLKNVQSEIERMKVELSNRSVTGESGGGMVSVEMTGSHKLRKIDISDELMLANDKAMIADLVVAAVNHAYDEADELNKSEMGKIQNFLPNIPGLNLNL